MIKGDSFPMELGKRNDKSDLDFLEDFILDNDELEKLEEHLSSFNMVIDRLSREWVTFKSISKKDKLLYELLL